jgi:hypothetical protein
MSQPTPDEHDETSREGSTVMKSDESKPQAAQPPPAPSYPTGFSFGITLFALFISLFCVALDSTIIATAIPRITDQFHALQDVGWYGSSYLLTKCGAYRWLLISICLLLTRVKPFNWLLGKRSVSLA